VTGTTEMTINPNGKLSLDVVNESLEKITIQHKKIGKIETPKGLIKKKQGFDYVELSYMKNMANEQFPGWSWTIVKSEALGSNAYVVHGRLKWLDNGLWREGDMVAAHRIQTKSGDSNTFVDIGNDIKSANTDCIKKALNVYMDIAADVYRSEDPTLDDNQYKQLMEKANKLDTDTAYSIAKKIENQEINSSNYKAALAKLERLSK
jgi:hypothetical protein